MKKKQKRESKIPKTQTNTNRKKQSDQKKRGALIDTSLFKKNEFALILFGAMLLTLIIFFLFFQSPEKPQTGKTVASPELNKKGLSTQSSSFSDLENRIQILEKSILGNPDSIQTGKATVDTGNLKQFRERISRLEAAFDLKFNTLMERMDSIEKKITALNLKNTAVSTRKTKSTKVQSTTKKVSASTTKKTTDTSKKAPMFHTVQKGDTLYGISRKYNVSVATLQKLNKLTAKSKIYPGMELLIR